MLASIAEVSLKDPQYVYEPKYDGIRALVAVEAGTDNVQIVSRLDNDKTSQTESWTIWGMSCPRWPTQRRSTGSVAPTINGGDALSKMNGLSVSVAERTVSAEPIRKG